MTTNERWVQWKPIEGLAKNYSIESLSDTESGLIVVLSEYKNEKRKIAVIFENSVASYRNTNESLRLQLLNKLFVQHGDQFYTQWTFFKVVNSEYLKWLSQQSEGISERFGFTHFVIFGIDSVVKIICGYKPRVELWIIQNDRRMDSMATY